MTDAPPLNGGDPTAILDWLVAQVTELREENGRMKTLLALHGVTPIEECEFVLTTEADIFGLRQRVSNCQGGIYSVQHALSGDIADLKAEIHALQVMR